MLRALLIALALGLTTSTASAQQAYTLKKVCNGRTCYYVKVPVNNTSHVAPTVSYDTPAIQSNQSYTWKKVCDGRSCYYVKAPVTSYSTPIVETTVRNRSILGDTVVNSSVAGTQTTVVENVPTVTPPTPKTSSTDAVDEVPELELLNL